MRYILTLLALLPLGCGGGENRPLHCPDPAAAHDLASVLPARKAEVVMGIDNFHRLSSTIFSGAEPQGEEAFAVLAARGVRTILSVDGKAPDATRAKRHGLRYVHIPIRYNGIEKDELDRIVKTFRELPGPFFVHCYHGKHRGPAAAALGRLVLDGADRTRALGEMRWWCGTSEKYEGLYHTVATADLPSPAETRALRWTPPARDVPRGERRIMVELARLDDQLALFAKRDWRLDPAHPDLAPERIASTMRDLFHQAATAAGTQADGLMRRSWRTAGELEKLLTSAPTPADRTRAHELYRQLRNTCKECHRQSRN